MANPLPATKRHASQTHDHSFVKPLRVKVSGKRPISLTVKAGSTVTLATVQSSTCLVHAAVNNETQLISFTEPAPADPLLFKLFSSALS